MSPMTLITMGQVKRAGWTTTMSARPHLEGDPAEFSLLPFGDEVGAQWSTSKTTTIGFSVPPGQKAFTC